MITTLAKDEVATVRAGVLEALAEVIYSFHEACDEPPEELVNLFLGIRQDAGSSTLSLPEVHLNHVDAHVEPPSEVSTQEPENTDAESAEEESAEVVDSEAPAMTWSEFMATVNKPKEYDIYDDPSRPLVCAFNFPAVALTLGREQWPKLRDLYRSLGESASFKVRRTLAASLGEMAKIIGPEHARQDLLPVWWSSACSEEGEVRLKAMEAMELFMEQLLPEDRGRALRGLEHEIWNGLRGWRERETVTKLLRTFVKMDGMEPEILRRLLRRGLTDSVSAVRETAISIVSVC